MLSNIGLRESIEEDYLGRMLSIPCDDIIQKQYDIL